MSPNQSLQEKYPHLEVSVLKLSEVREDNESFRIDSEYFKKEYLENENKLINQKYLILSDMTTQITDFGAYSQTNMIEFLENGVLFLRNQDIKNTFVDLSENTFIHQNIFDQLSLKLQEFDIVIPRVGTLGNAAIIENKHLPCSANQNLAVIRLKDEFNPYFTTLFLCCESGKMQILRASTGNVQPWLNLSTIGRIKIPILPMSFQLEIEKMVKDSHKALEESKELYKKAEETLYLELGLDPKNPLQSLLDSHTQDSTKPLNISIRTLKESFLQTGRLDSEYYQAKYEAVETMVKSYHGGWDIIANCFKQNKRSCDFVESEYKYIEIGDINVSSSEVTYNIVAIEEIPANAKIKVNIGDILISKVRPNRGAVAIINFECENIVASGAFVVLAENNRIKKEVLQVLLRTKIYKEWLLKYNVGTSYPVIHDKDVLNLPIPKIDSIVQEKIAHYIQESFRLKNESKLLLSEVKAKVESTIANGVTSK